MNENIYRGFRPGVRTLACESPSSLLDFVASQLALEPTQANPLELIDLGAVYINGERSLNPARMLKNGDEVRVHTEPRRFSPPSDFDARIITENEDILLVEKPAGLPSEPLVDNVKENLISFLEDYRGQSLFLTHRLSAESEGLMLVAKTAEAQARILRAFAEGQIKRVYVAYTEKPVATGEIMSPSGLIHVLSCQEQRARTNLLSDGPKTWLLNGDPLDVCYRVEIEFQLARPKDVREHLASSGAPVIGDRAHGSRHELVDPVTQKSAMAFRAISLGL